LQAANCLLIDLAFHLDIIIFPGVVLRGSQIRLQSTIRGQDQQTFRIGVESTGYAIPRGTDKFGNTLFFSL
jgi:hypothetical protein